MACSGTFGTPGWVRTSGLSLRRRPLYPTELRGLIQKIFNFRVQPDSNELPLRRRSLYPAELRKQKAAEPPRLFSKFCLALREETLAVHDKALVRALSDKTGFIRCFNTEGQTATVDFGQRCRTGDVHADRGR